MSKYSLQRLENLILDLLNEVLVTHTQQFFGTENVSFTQVYLSKDKSFLRVYVDTFNRNKIVEITKILNNNVKIFRHYLATNLQTRSVPRIVFAVDEIIDNVSRIEQVISEINHGKSRKN